MVTSTGSGLSVPDWPTTYGSNMFTFPLSKWVGGIRYEHSHRLIASAVGFLTIILAGWTWRVEPRRWVRWLAVACLGAVVLQGLLGGLTVLLRLPPAVSIGHAGLAQIFLLPHADGRNGHVGGLAHGDVAGRRRHAPAPHRPDERADIHTDHPRRDDAPYERRDGDSDVSAGVRPSASTRSGLPGSPFISRIESARSS